MLYKKLYPLLSGTALGFYYCASMYLKCSEACLNLLMVPSPFIMYWYGTGAMLGYRYYHCTVLAFIFIVLRYA